MVHTYQITGMTCGNCENIVRKALQQIHGIMAVDVSREQQTATLTMHHHIGVKTLQQALGSQYQITPIESGEIPVKSQNNSTMPGMSWTDFSTWKRAGFNTFNCLVGCSIGDFAMIIFLQYYYPETPMMVQMILAVIAGLMTSIALETTLLHFRETLAWKEAFKMAIGMSLLSMIAMEVAMNATDFMITGGKMALSDPNYWLAFIPAAIIGFLVPMPYNYYQLKKHNKACH